MIYLNMNFDSLNKRIKKIGIILSVYSVLFIIAIPGVVLSALNGIWALLGVCVLLVFSGIYVLTIGWSFWAKMIINRNIAVAIVEDGITNIKTLATAFGKWERIMRRDVAQIMRKRYITGYVFNEKRTELVRTERSKREEAQKAESLQRKKCESCGAALIIGAKACCHCGVMI